MGKVLPIRIPPAETYQGVAFLMGIMLEESNISNAVYNSFINVKCNTEGELMLRFDENTCEPFRKKGIVEMDLFYLRNLAKEKWVDFFKERLDQDNYLLLFSIDEFYLSYTENYNIKHYDHDTYIYGYDENSFHVMAYRDRHLQLLTVPQEEIVEGLYSRLLENSDTHFCSLRPYHVAKVDLMPQEILGKIEAYLHGSVMAEGVVSGRLVYDVIYHYLEEIEKARDVNLELDPKLFRMFWEHKKVMMHRNQIMGEEICSVRELQNEIDSIAQKASRIMILALKFNKNRDYAILSRISDYIREVAVKEEEYLQRVVQQIKIKKGIS